jgi:hypothetical protein
VLEGGEVARQMGLINVWVDCGVGTVDELSGAINAVGKHPEK